MESIQKEEKVSVSRLKNNTKFTIFGSNNCIVISTKIFILKLQSWNVDTISKDGFSKSSINKQLPRKQQDMSEEEREEKMKKFVQENQKDLKAFGWLSKMDDSKGAK